MAHDNNGLHNITPHTIINNRYTIKNLIARGGMASTYLAEDKKTGQPVVLKILSLSKLENWKTLELFKREISVLKNINHPQIPEYIEHFEQTLKDDTCYILVQEYADGSNLYDLVKKGKRFTIPEVRELLSGLLNILSVIHGLNPPVIHRDINPKNIIMDKKGVAHLVDFSASGFIKKTTLAAAKSDTFVGTIGYIPPEQFYGKVMPQSDIYALGVTIIFLLTGMDPSEFELINLRLDYKPYISLPPDLEALLDAMTNPDSEKRPASAVRALGMLKNQYQGKGEDILGEGTEKMATAQPGGNVPVLYVHGWLKKDSMLVNPPLMYKKNIWTFNTNDLFFGEKGAVILAVTRNVIWMGFLFITVFDTIFGM